MNNDKVRIYDLSKELNLENKDLLIICHQLNISVKSHSSTISEGDAERIRYAAKTYTPTPHGKGGHDPQTEESGDKSHKHQILAVHHKQSDSEVDDPSINKTLQNPPSRSSVKAQPPKSSISQDSNSNDSSSFDPQGIQPSPMASVTPPASPSVQLPVNQATPSAPKPPKPPQTPEKKKAELDRPQPQLVTPPARPAKPLPPKLEGKTVDRPKRNDGTKDTPKTERNDRGDRNRDRGDRNRDRDRQKPRGEKGEGENRPPKPSEKSDAPVTPRDRGIVAIKERDRDKEPLKLQKPKRPEPPTKVKPELLPPPVMDIDVDEEEKDDDIELLELDDVGIAKTERVSPKLKRPNPPKLGKKPGWEEEEEEEKPKAGKTKTAKRRSQYLVDDEDDDDLKEELALLVSPDALNMSIARPPKPKSSSPISVTAKPKKASKGEQKSDNKDKRRERPPEKQRPTSIVLPESLTVQQLAELLVVPETDIIKTLFLKGIMVNITQILDQEIATLVTKELGVEVVEEELVAAATKVTEMLDVADLDNLQRRPPVVTIMGHVDHGKTTLLDSIRKTKVAQGEAGGITQHIGAYHVDVEHNGKMEQVVFLDTPGHEAFTAMRARGARVTDIAILVVAADDGVQPQTQEAISHAKAAGVPILVAINKVDKPGAEPDRIKQELTEFGLVAEEWGGDTIMVPVSALKGDNLDTLLEMVLLVAEMEELSANPNRPAKGTVIEANLDRSRGPVATLIVQNGTLRVGDIIVAGSVYGKIRAMIDDRGNRVEAATPSFAVEVLGLNDVPAAGDEFSVYETERDARQTAESREEGQRQTRLESMLRSRVSLSTISAQAQEGELKELNLILKTDVQGSAEAIVASLKQLPQNEVQIRVLFSAPGEITETDVDLASASGAVIIGFNTTLASGARQAADREGVDIREYNIIYKLLDEIQGAMEGLLDPEEIEEKLGEVEVRQVFNIGKGAVAGCYVLSGKAVRNRQFRVRRDGQVIYEGILESLKRFKEEVKEVNTGYECGIGSNKFNDWKEGDIIETFQMVMKRRTLTV